MTTTVYLAMWAATKDTGERFISSLGIGPWTAGLFFTFISYAALCSALRYRRIQNLKSRMGFTDRASLSKMTCEQALEIARNISVYDFPTIYDVSLQIGALRTYCMDNIGGLLYATDLGKPTQMSKRVEDSKIFYSCCMEFPPGSDLLSKTVARINFLHAPYIKAGKIRNKDLIYVLFGSLAYPIIVIGQYEWRALDDIEIAALGTFWKYLGEMMDIDFKAELGKDQWDNGIDFFEDLVKWADGYEQEHMIPSQDVGKLGKLLLDLLLSAYPKFMRPFIQDVFMVLMGERMRHTFCFPDPGLVSTAFTYSFLLIRKYAMHHLALPRFTPVKYLTHPDPQTGRINQYDFLKDPWYTPVTAWSRWGPQALLRQAFGLSNPGDGGSQFKPEGFLFEDWGPQRQVGKGVEETARLAGVANSKVSAMLCPFAMKMKG